MKTATLSKKLSDLTSFEVACEILGIDPQSLPDFSLYPERHREGMIAHAKLVIIADAANRIENNGEEWNPDWSNHNQLKFNVWMRHPSERGSSGFRFDAVDDWVSLSSVGSRLCFINEKAADHVGRTFEELYKQYFTINE